MDLKKGQAYLQSSTNTYYGCTEELWDMEKYMGNYNSDLIAKLMRYYRKSSRILDFGAGIGTLASLCELETGIKPECVEIDTNQRTILTDRGFCAYQSLEIIQGKFDIIYTSNVLEHIKDDQKVLNELWFKLNDGGLLIIYVPAFGVLYSDLDRSLGHYRRYKKSDLAAKLKKASFEIDKSYYADSIGFFAWLFVKLKRQLPGNSESMNIYDKFIFPLSKILDALGCKYLFGKNLLIYAKKSSSV